MNAIVFLYKRFLKIDVSGLNIRNARRKKRIPVVFSHKEATQVIYHLPKPYQLMANLMYGSGLRLNECLRLRVKDIDFEMNMITIIDGKGIKDRRMLLPESLLDDLHNQIQYVKSLHNFDIENGYNDVYLPNALSRKYPKAASQLTWKYVFPSKNYSEDPHSNKIRRHHIMDTTV